MKTCRKCNEEKPLDQFHWHGGHTNKKGEVEGNHRSSRCKPCDLAYGREKRAKARIKKKYKFWVVG